MIGIYCVVYNLELVVLDVLKIESVFGEVKEMFKGIYKYYKYFLKVLCEVREVVLVFEEDFILFVNILGI